MLKASIKEIRSILKEYVSKDYYILWAFEEAMHRGSRYLEFFFSTKPLVSLSIEIDVLSGENIIVHGVKVVLNKSDIEERGTSWNNVLANLKRSNVLKNLAFYRENRDNVYIVIDLLSLKDLGNVIKNITAALREAGIEVPGKTTIVGYDYME
ncbi:MAG: hypothetical protein DRO23_07635 [Thermoprotei archaeon]|nr:MAG: hypothetical protein DRO23_07635 [Thermoprotei archaeon]